MNAKVRDALGRWGLLLLFDSRYPSVASLVVGSPVRKTWWSHPRGREIFGCTQELEREAEKLKLIGGKLTFVHRRLWPALAGAAIGPRLTEVHTESGRHEYVRSSWKKWAKEEGVKPVPQAEARRAVVRAASSLRRCFGGDPRLPWEAAEVRPAGPRDLRAVRELLRAYRRELPEDTCLAGLDREAEGLPGEYAAPDGRLLVARVRGRVAGCVALRPLDQRTAEMRRLFLDKRSRGLGLGRRLAEAILGEARAAGYARMRLDTERGMKAAQGLYRSLGFRVVKPYRDSECRRAVFMETPL